MHLARDIIRPPAQADLELNNLNNGISRAELQERLSGIEFNCSDDKSLGYGKQACFAPVTQVDDLKAKYLALYFDEDEILSAVNIVLDPDEHSSTIEYLKEQFGENNYKQIIDEDNWFIWQNQNNNDGLIMAHHEDSQDHSSAVMWFRDKELAKQLLSH